MIEQFNQSRKLKREFRVGKKLINMDTKQIVENHKDITLEHVDTSKTKFCSIWPQAKEALGVLQGIIKNPIAKAAIGIVIAAGDAVSKSICG